MLKLIQKNPYREDTSSGSIWAMGFYAGQKSMITTASVTGRWWQAKNKEVFFIYKNQYAFYERITENNSDNSRWLSNEETREFE